MWSILVERVWSVRMEPDGMSGILENKMRFIHIFQTGFMFNALITRLSKDPMPEDIVFVIPLFCLAIISTVAIITLEVSSENQT